jgi:hypothetical protein
MDDVTKDAINGAFKDGVARLFSVLHTKAIDGAITDQDLAEAKRGFTLLKETRDVLSEALG